MAQIDPQEFGRLQARVEALEAKADKVNEKIDALLELAHRSQGAFWVVVVFGGAVGSAVGFLISKTQVLAGLLR